MEDPSFLLDAAEVLEHAGVDGARLPPGFSLVVAGVSLGAQNVAGVAIVRALVDDRLYVLHCNDRWETLAAAPVGGVAEAREEAERAYGRDALAWTPFRSHTPEERREIESTRAFLRDLAAEP